MLSSLLKKSNQKCRRFLQRQFGTALLQEKFDALDETLRKQSADLHTSLQQKLDSLDSTIDRSLEKHVAAQQATLQMTLASLRDALDKQTLADRATWQRRLDAFQLACENQTAARHDAVQRRFDSLQTVLEQQTAAQHHMLQQNLEPFGETWARHSTELQTLLQEHETALAGALEKQATDLLAVRESQLSVQQFCDTIAQSSELIDGLRHLVRCFEDLHKFKFAEWVGLLRHLRKIQYLESVARNELPVPELRTEYPVAEQTNDHLYPRGAKNDNSIVPRFNQRIYELLGRNRQLSVLDLGCAGGGFVRSLIDDGHVAVGLEGSDYPRLTQKDEWSTIPHHLHTCDIVKPFAIVDPATNQPWLFDAVTAWELMEHLTEAEIPPLLENIRKHLKPDGYVFLSIATFRDEVDGIVYHHTVRPKHWWKTVLTNHHFDVAPGVELGKDDWVRGSGHCFGDWHEDAEMGFHIALTPKNHAGQHAGQQPGSVATGSHWGAVA